MATLRNKRKLAAVSRETPESTRSGKAPSVLDPELTQEYISQVSKEIEGRVTKKLSKEFSRTESRILGALSKLDEFLLNPQVRTCSVVASGTSRSNNLENQGTNEDRPSDDPGPEVEFASPISGAETNPHSNSFSNIPACYLKQSTRARSLLSRDYQLFGWNSFRSTDVRIWSLHTLLDLDCFWGFYLHSSFNWFYRVGFAEIQCCFHDAMTEL